LVSHHHRLSNLLHGYLGAYCQDLSGCHNTTQVVGASPPVVPTTTTVQSLRQMVALPTPKFVNQTACHEVAQVRWCDDPRYASLEHKTTGLLLATDVLLHQQL
jgi:hypothetical protein